MIFNITKFFLDIIIKTLTKLSLSKSIRFKILLNTLSEICLKKKINNLFFYFSVENDHCLKRYNTILTKEKGKFCCCGYVIVIVILITYNNNNYYYY